MRQKTICNLFFSLPALNNLVYLRHFCFVSQDKCEALVNQIFERSASSFYEEMSVTKLIVLKYAEELFDQFHNLHDTAAGDGE